MKVVGAFGDNWGSSGIFINIGAAIIELSFDSGLLRKYPLLGIVLDMCRGLDWICLVSPEVCPGLRFRDIWIQVWKFGKVEKSGMKLENRVLGNEKQKHKNKKVACLDKYIYALPRACITQEREDRRGMTSHSRLLRFFADLSHTTKAGRQDAGLIIVATFLPFSVLVSSFLPFVRPTECRSPRTRTTEGVAAQQGTGAARAGGRQGGEGSSFWRMAKRRL